MSEKLKTYVGERAYTAQMGCGFLKSPRERVLSWKSGVVEEADISSERREELSSSKTSRMFFVMVLSAEDWNLNELRNEEREPSKEELKAADSFSRALQADGGMWKGRLLPENKISYNRSYAYRWLS